PRGVGGHRQRRWLRLRERHRRPRSAEHAGARVRGRWPVARRPGSRKRLAATLRATDPLGGRALTTEKTRILLCDDHEVVREGLRGLIARQEGMSVVGEAGTVAEVIETAARTKPDVVIMDVRLPDGSGVEACRTIRETRPETKVIMLTSYADDEALFA